MKRALLALTLAVAFGAHAAHSARSGTAASSPASAPSEGLERLGGALTLEELNEQAERWATEGFDDPDAALRRLDELQQSLAAGTPLAWARVIERTRGVVAARSGREALAQEAAGRLSQMAAQDAVAAADAAMVRALLDEQLWRNESAIGHAVEADAAYSKACAGEAGRRGCD